jgi:hypothetical protein
MQKILENFAAIVAEILEKIYRQWVRIGGEQQL